MQDPNAQRGDLTKAASTGSSVGPSATTKADRQWKIETSKWVITILSGFWTENTADDVRSLELVGWLDALEGVSVPELRTAWTQYQRTGARTAAGRLVKPDAGALYYLVVSARRDAELLANRAATARPPPQPVREPASEAARKAIMAEVWGERLRDGQIDLTISPKRMP